MLLEISVGDLFKLTMSYQQVLPIAYYVKEESQVVGPFPNCLWKMTWGSLVFSSGTSFSHRLFIFIFQSCVTVLLERMICFKKFFELSPGVSYLIRYSVFVLSSDV